MNKPHPHADLLRAIANGEQIEVSDSADSTKWFDATAGAALFQIGHGFYETVRIKPAKREARRWWLVTNGDPTGVIYPQNDRESAAIWAIRNHGVVIPVREVLPDEQ